MIALLTRVGLTEAHITARFDCFRGTSKESDARQFSAYGVNLFARRPDNTNHNKEN
jgi:hypothetical protein